MSNVTFHAVSIKTFAPWQDLQSLMEKIKKVPRGKKVIEGLCHEKN